VKSVEKQDIVKIKQELETGAAGNDFERHKIETQI